MAKTKGLSPADLELWAAYARTLRLLPHARRAAPRAQPVPPPAAQPDPPKPAGPRPAAGPVGVNIQPAGLDRASWRRFSAGQARPARTLDLHGMTAARAHRAVTQFIQQAHATQLRVVEIITGKGEILFRELPHWLNAPELRPLILALAHPHAGNTGSVRVLLRRLRG